MIPPLRLNPIPITIVKVARLLDELQRELAHAGSTAEDIHKIRVCCKKLRGWIRLLRHKRGAGHWRQTDGALRKIVHKFALARDRTVLRQTVEELQATTRSARNRAACRQVLAQLKTRAPARSANKVAPLAKRIVWELLAGKVPTGKAVTRGLQLTYARGARLARQAFTSANSTGRLHDLRRWVKYLAYQLELVTLPTAASEKFRKQLVDLGRTLGRVHDLDVLRQQLRAMETLSPSATALVMAQATRLERRLIVRAEVLARLVFEK